MKSTELFDLLGEIDDKFYEEARIPDEQHGFEVVSEHRPFSGFMSIFLPIAACVAIIVAVAVGANFVSRNAGILPPNEFDSDSSADVTLSSDSGVSSSDTSSSTSSEESSVPVQNNKEIRLEDYPPIDLATVPDIKGSGLQVQVEQQEKTLQKATLATLKCGDYELHMLGRFIHFDKSDKDELYSNKLYSYYVTLALSKDGKVISDDGTHTRSVSMGQGGYVLDAEQLSTYLEYYELNGAPLIICKYPSEIYPGSIGYEATFFSIVDDKLVWLMGDFSGIEGASMDGCAEFPPNYTVSEKDNTLISGDIIYKFNCENFGKNPYDAPHFTVAVKKQDSVLDLSEYPMVDISEIPDVGNDPNDTTNALPKATLAEKQVGGYTLSLIGENVRTSLLLQKDEDMKFMADSVRSVISKDGVVIRQTNENGTGVRTLMLTEQEAYDLLPDAYEMKDGIVFGLDKKSVQLSGTPTFGTIKNDVMLEFTPPILGYDDRDPFEGTVSVATGKVVLLPEENALILDGKKYVFDFDKITYTETIEDNELDIGDYKPFDGNALWTVQPKVILDVKDTAEYRFYLLGDNVKKQPAEVFPLVDCGKLFIAVEKNGKIVARVDADIPPYLNGLKISDYIQPFEMKDGTGFVMYYILNELSPMNSYAMLYKIENDTVTKLRYDMDFAPAPATGSPHYVGENFKVDFEKNAIVDDNGTITIDFNGNTFSRS